MDGKRARSLMRGVAALALAMSLGTRWVYILILRLSIHPPSFASLSASSGRMYQLVDHRG